MQDISKGEGRTVLFVSHDMGAIKNLCSRLIILEDGKVSYEGNVLDGIDKYLNNFITGNLHYHNPNCTNGISSVNFFDKDNKKIDSISNYFE